MHEFLHLWYKYKVRKISCFVRLTFHVIKVYEQVYYAKSKYSIMIILSELVFIPQT